MANGRRTARWLALLLAALLLLSPILIACETDHDCAGEGCVICVMLRVCEGLMRLSCVCAVCLLIPLAGAGKLRPGFGNHGHLYGLPSPVALRVKLTD